LPFYVYNIRVVTRSIFIFLLAVNIPQHLYAQVCPSEASISSCKQWEDDFTRENKIYSALFSIWDSIKPKKHNCDNFSKKWKTLRAKFPNIPGEGLVYPAGHSFPLDNSDAVIDHLCKWEVDQSDLKGMSIEEITAIHTFTHDGFLELNSFLRTGKSSASDNKSLIWFSQLIKSALRKLPVYRGWVRRGTKLPDAILDQYRPGKIVSDRAFVSTASKYADFEHQEDLSRFAKYPHQMLIYSKRGRDVRLLSDIPMEHEVLFDSNTKFKVLCRELRGANGMLIVLEESD